METINEKKNKKKTVDLSTLVYGKLPPQVREIECAILGTMLQFPQCVTDVIEVLNKNDFYVEANQIIFNAIVSDK